MRDAIGGSVNVFFVAVFLIVVAGYLAFSITYNRAFRVKNKIINLLETHKTYALAEGDIKNYIKEIGYSTAKINVNCKSYPKSKAQICDMGYCITWISEGDSDDLSRGYYKVTTAVRIDIPMVNQLLPNLHFLDVSGDTVTLYDIDGTDGLMGC